MKAFVLLAHPEPNSFNGSLARISREKLEATGWEVAESDLYASRFDPCEGPSNYESLSDGEKFHAQTEQRFHADNDTTPADVAAERDKLLQSDLLVVHFPLWWFGMPAILKGWIDRTFVYGSVYRSQMRYDQGICRGKKMIACITTGASAESCSFSGRESDTKMLAWPLIFPFRYIGFDVLAPVVFHGVGGVASIEAEEGGLSDIDRYKRDWEETLVNIHDRSIVPFNRDTDFDESKRLRPDAPAYSPFVSHTEHSLWD